MSAPPVEELSEQEYEDCKETFRERFEELIKDFTDQLPYTKATKDKYAYLLGALNEYLYGYTQNISIATIKPSEVCSKFYASARYDHDFEPGYKKQILRFFVFIDDLGYSNPKVIQHLKKSKTKPPKLLNQSGDNLESVSTLLECYYNRLFN